LVGIGSVERPVPTLRLDDADPMLEALPSAHSMLVAGGTGVILADATPLRRPLCDGAFDVPAAALEALGL
jgi:hypothetical protein